MADPATRDEIVAALGDLARDGAAFWGSFSPEVFVAPIGEAWSPADNVRHLSKSTNPVADAMKLPTVIPSLLYGRASEPSRTFADIRGVYLEALAGGVTAGKFAPSEQTVVPDRATFQRDVIDRWAAVVNRLARVAGGWSESALDTSRLPHPAIGKLTVREMLYFTLYHHTHHAATVTRRLAELGE